MNSNLTVKEILNLNLSQYSSYFKNPEFGKPLALEILKNTGINYEPVRITEGSNLVFSLGEELFLKIFPAFIDDSFETEKQVTALYHGNFSFQIPEIVETGLYQDWPFMITRRVKGIQAYRVLKELTFADKKLLAHDLGAMIKEISQIPPLDFERSFGPWKTYLKERLKNQYEFHLKKGNTIEWTTKIVAFVEKNKENLLSLEPEVLVHADINPEHVMLENKDGKWRATGLLDLADTMKAPAEVEFLLPFMDFFRGSVELQDLMLESAGYKRKLERREFSEMLLALTLQKRFMAFYDWFVPELKNGISSLEDIAAAVYPYK